jgi:5-(aminomethyl)-3-furanmethanol phosphate kinase
VEEAARVTLIVVKVGGSFARSSRLPELAAALARGSGRVVIVPGGGPFADCVRDEQPQMRFDDAAAHRMALLAMAQFGYALCALLASLAPAPSLNAVRRILAAGGLPVWLPLDLLRGAPNVPATWDTTSDSLAAWLARRLGAARLILVKSASAPSSVLADLIAADIVDPLLPHLLAGAKFETWLCGAQHIDALGEALAADQGAGLRVALA